MIEFKFIITESGIGSVVIAVFDVYNSIHRYHMDVTNWNVGASYQYFAENQIKLIVRDRINPEDTFTGEIEIALL